MGKNKRFGILQNFVITIPTGLYDLSGLNQSIARELEIAGAKSDPSPLITLSPDEPTQRVSMRLNYNDVSVDFRNTDTFREILGFNSLLYGPYVNPIDVLAPNVAEFNQINYFLIHSDLTTRGIRFNNNYTQSIAQVLIDTPPGSQIVSKPFNPAKVNCQELAGVRRSSIRIWLTDDRNRRVNTNSETYSCRIVISYLIPV